MCMSDISHTSSFVISANMNLTGTIPDEIQFLEDIQLLHFDNNVHLEGIVPTDVMLNLTSLEEFWVQDTSLTGNITAPSCNCGFGELCDFLGLTRTVLTAHAVEVYDSSLGLGLYYCLSCEVCQICLKDQSYTVCQGVRK